MARDFEGSDSGNWNIAEDWTKEMIFKPFYECSQYLTLSRFGCSDLDEDFMITDDIKKITRIKSLNWAQEKLEMGIRQFLFAIRGDVDNKKVMAYLNDVVMLRKYLPQIEIKITDRDNVKIEVNEEMFELIYQMLKKVYTEVTIPMNKNDLIFMHKEIFDPKEMKNRIKERFMEGE